MSLHDGRYGNGYQPVPPPPPPPTPPSIRVLRDDVKFSSRPPTTEYRNEPELPFSLVYLGGFCVFMLGIALGASIG